MSRTGILAVATLLAVLAGVLPLVAMSHLSRERAVAAERARLALEAERTLKRVRITLARTRQALLSLERDGWQGCTPAHVARMRELNLDAPPIEEIGFFEHGRLACTSWGVVEGVVPAEPLDLQLPGGLGLNLEVHPVASREANMLALRYGRHNALVKPERLVDNITDDRVWLGLVTRSGRPVVTSAGLDPALVAGLGGAVPDDRYLYASRAEGELVAFAVADLSGLQARLAAERRTMVPLGLLASTVLVGLVVWLSQQRLSPQREIEIGLRRHEFVVHYQPIIELAGGGCVGAEALLRWQRPDGEWIPPHLFIPVAERSGLIDRLTDHVIDQVAGDLAGMLGGEPDLHVSINLSASDLHSGRFAPVLDAALQRHGVAPERIWLEATERGFIDAAAAGDHLRRAREAGHRVAIDDFGTGYSSLALLESLPLDALKIDKAFIDAIGKGAATGVVTPHVIRIAHSLGLDIVAEGVETPGQAAYLAREGVHYAQGWLYSPALPVEEFAAYFQRRRTAPSLKAVV